MSEQKFHLLALNAMKLDPAALAHTPQPDGLIKWEFKPDSKSKAPPSRIFVGAWLSG